MPPSAIRWSMACSGNRTLLQTWKRNVARDSRKPESLAELVSPPLDGDIVQFRFHPATLHHTIPRQLAQHRRSNKFERLPHSRLLLHRNLILAGPHKPLREQNDRPPLQALSYHTLDPPEQLV